MSTRKVYMDYGTGEQDVSSLIRDDLVIDNKAFSDDYKYAQNVANFTVNYDPTLYTGLKNATSIKTRIIDEGVGIEPEGLVVTSGLVGYYSMKKGSIPDIPDGAAGTTYVSVPNWTGGVNGWLGTNCTLSIEGGKLKIVVTSADPKVYKLFGDTVEGKDWLFKVSNTSDFNLCLVHYSDTTQTVLTTTDIGNGVYKTLIPITAKTVDWLRIDPTSKSSGTYYLDYCYIGDGSYTTVAPDNSGHGSNLVLYGVTPSAAGLIFDGINDYAIYTLSAPQTILTMSVRAKVAAVGASEALMSTFKYNGGTGGSGFACCCENATTLRIVVGRTGTTYQLKDIPHTWDTAAFHTYTVIYLVASRIFQFFVDGIYVGQTSACDATANLSASYFVLGRSFGDYPDYYISATIRDARFFNRALTSSEITQLYQAKSLFQGIIPTNISYKYNGILDNTQIALEAVDDSTRLDKRCGDIIYRNYYIMNSSDTAHSIVHQLAYLAGYTDAQIDQDIRILTIVEAFSPPSEDESILTLLNVFLYEYGYALSFNISGQISPIQWNTTDTYEYQFDDTNIIDSVERTEEPIEYEGVEITYNELGDRSNVLLYREDLPYDSTGGFAGYSIPSGYMYPAEANVIDDTTGSNQVVDYVYTDESIKYFTNKAVVKGITEQYSYKAFSSDFSSIVATSGHVLNWNADRKNTDVVVVTSGYDVVIDGENVPTYYFGNKKARVILKNNGAAAFLYYLNINGDVLYRTADRKLLVQNIVNTTKIDKYTANFLFNATDVSALATGLAKEHEVGNTKYSFKSAVDKPVGLLTKIYTDDGTNQNAVILDKRFDEQTGLCSYNMKSRSVDRGSLTQKRISRYSNSTEQTYLYTGKQIIVAPVTYGGYDADIYCDGTNDHEKVQSAIDYATINGIDVKCLSGDYDIGGTIVMKENTELFGVGVTFKVNKYLNPVIDLSQYSGVGINDIIIDGNKSLVTYSGSLDIIIQGDSSKIKTSYATNVTIQNFKHYENNGIRRFRGYYYIPQINNSQFTQCEQVVASGTTTCTFMGFAYCSTSQCAYTYNSFSGYAANTTWNYGFYGGTNVVGCDISHNTMTASGITVFMGYSHSILASNCTFNYNICNAGSILSPNMGAFYYTNNVSTCEIAYNTSSGILGIGGELDGVIQANNVSTCTLHDNNCLYMNAFSSCNGISNNIGTHVTSSGGLTYGLLFCYSAHLNKMTGFTYAYASSYSSATASGIYICMDNPNGGFNS